MGWKEGTGKGLEGGQERGNDIRSPKQDPQNGKSIDQPSQLGDISQGLTPKW